MTDVDMNRKGSDYHHGNLKEALLATSIGIVSEEGHKALTLRAVSKRLGVSSPALYRHYQSRADLLLSVVADTLKKLNLRLEQARSKTPDLAMRPAAVAGAIIDFGHDHPNLYQLINELEVPPAHREATKARTRVDETIDHAFLDAHPGLSERQLRMQALLMWFLLYGYFAVQRNQPRNSRLRHRAELSELRTRLIAMATDIGGAKRSSGVG